jgi:HprK-related kinase A
MRTVSSLSRSELGRRLGAGGIHLQTGAFVTCVNSPIASVADGIALLYADYPLCDGAPFADFHISLAPSRGLRRWVRPQVRFDFDGASPFLPLPIEQAFPLFEWSMNACVSSRANGYLIIHAAVVEKDGLAAILPAPSGSGKSTLCAALVTRGWRLLSDELALLHLASGQLEALPRPISLKNASIDIIRGYAPAAVFSPAVRDTVKGAIAHMKAPAASVARALETARPAWIIFPQYKAGAAAELAPVAPARAFMDLAGNAFNYSLLGGAGFAALAGLIDATRAYQFTYSALDDAVAQFARLEAGAA